MTSESDEGHQTSSVAAQAIEIIGDATPEQVAALVAVLSAASGGAVEVEPRQTSPWSAPARQHRKPVTPSSRDANSWQNSPRS